MVKKTSLHTFWAPWDKARKCDYSITLLCDAKLWSHFNHLIDRFQKHCVCFFLKNTIINGRTKHKNTIEFRYFISINQGIIIVQCIACKRRRERKSNKRCNSPTRQNDLIDIVKLERYESGWKSNIDNDERTKSKKKLYLHILYLVCFDTLFPLLFRQIVCDAQNSMAIKIFGYFDKLLFHIGGQMSTKHQTLINWWIYKNVLSTIVISRWQLMVCSRQKRTEFFFCIAKKGLLIAINLFYFDTQILMLKKEIPTQIVWNIITKPQLDVSSIISSH